MWSKTEGMIESCHGECRGRLRTSAKKWRSQQIEIMLRERTAGDLELLARRAEKEKRWRTFVLFTY